MLDTLRNDIRFALRTLSRAPGFTIAAVATLGLGIGATALVFSMVNAMLLRPFPFDRPERLVNIEEADMETRDMHVGTSYPNFLSWREQARSFSSISAFNERSLSMRVGNESEHYSAASVSANIFSTLGIGPVAGRSFIDAEDTPAGPRAVIISFDVWQKKFAGSKDAIGRTVYINAEAHTIVGVMPRDFRFPAYAELWVPMRLGASEDRGERYMSVVGRLKDGVALKTAQTEMRTVSARLEAAYPGPNGDHVTNVDNLQAAAVRKVKPVMLVLLGAVGFVLLIACANVANLMLARAASRDREMAIRSAIGAGGWRLVRQLLTESLIISMLGGALGVLVGSWWLDLLVSRLPEEMPYWMKFTIDPTVLAFVAGIAVLTSIVFGMAPALQAGRADLQGVMKEGGRATVGTHRTRMRNVFVVSQLAAAIVLLVGAVLMVRSFAAMRRVDPGFDVTNILTYHIELPVAKYPDDARRAAAYDNVVREVAAVPGVEKAAVVKWFPISGSSSTSNFSVEGVGEIEGANAFNEAVTPDYFSAMGIEVLKGRAFNDRDRAGSGRVVIVNQKFADRFFPNTDPIGKGATFGAGDNIEYARIVGVVGNVNERDVNQEEVGIDIYTPVAQTPMGNGAVVVRTRGDAAAVQKAVREAVRRIDADISMFEPRTVEAVLREATWDSRLTGSLFTFFGLGALMLAGIGLYGVIAYSVTQRTHEIGVRVALGASRTQVIRMVLRQGARLTAAGLVVGMSLAFALSRVLSTMLFGVSNTDPYTFAAVPLLLATVAMVATYLPARRATRVNPITALRAD